LVIDTDEDPRTGLPGIDSLCSYDPDTVGTDSIVQVGGTSRPTVASVHRAVTSCNEFQLVAEAPVMSLGDGYRVAVPLVSLGDIDGFIAYKATSATEIRPGASSGIEDVLPDVGLPPARNRPSG
jgi:hypothetical protein